MVCTTGFPNPCRRAAHQSSSLFPLHSPHSGLPVPLPGSASELLSAGVEDQFPGSNAELQNTLSPRTAPPAGHRLILNPCRKAALRNSSLFSILSSLAQPRPSPPTSREGQRTALRRGGGSVPRQQYGTAKRSFPPHSPACRAQARSEPVPQSGTPQLFTLLYSLFTRPALPLFPSGTDSKTKIYFVFWSLDT